MIRRAIAKAVIATLLGVLYEVQCERPSLIRAPFTGAGIWLGCTAADWACRQLADDLSADHNDPAGSARARPGDSVTQPQQETPCGA